MKKLVISLGVIAMLLLASGCSMMNYSGSKNDFIKRVATQRAAVSGDQAVVRAVGEGNYLRAGIDLADPAFWDVMAEHPIRATVAAVADLATAAAATWAITATVDNSHHDTASVNISTTGSGNNTSVNVGNTGSTIENENFAGDQTVN